MTCQLYRAIYRLAVVEWCLSDKELYWIKLTKSTVCMLWAKCKQIFSCNNNKSYPVFFKFDKKLKENRYLVYTTWVLCRFHRYWYMYMYIYIFVVKLYTIDSFKYTSQIKSTCVSPSKIQNTNKKYLYVHFCIYPHKKIENINKKTDPLNIPVR